MSELRSIGILAAVGTMGIGLGLALVAGAQQEKPKLGYKDTPLLPGGRWHVHDGDRPMPPVIDPGTSSTQESPGKPPSDAIVLFDGTDLSGESKETLAMYGAEPGKPSYANACLLARRLVERGVRFVQIFHEAWDHHGGLTQGLKDQCGKTDAASAALVKDLKRRGLLDDTLVIWGGEFGRTPMVQGGNDGRDHHPNAFTMWLAGGGIKPGITLGKTDDLGFNAVEDRVHVHDLQATILHLLGLEHTRLTYRFQGRDFRLTDVEGKVVAKLLA